MSISLRDHKMLWGRAAARCSLCRTPLATVSEIGLASIIGEEAHIVARNADGPRGESPISADQRNSYSNLILLCPTDHAVIDDLPNGPMQYPVEELQKLKAEHEQWAMRQDSFDADLQLADEQWAAIVDGLDSGMSWDSWTRDVSLLFSTDQCISETVYDRLKNTCTWIMARIWPPGHEYLRDSIKTMGRVLDDLLLTFEEHMIDSGDDSQMLCTEKFYKQLTYWDPERYRALVREYEFHAALVEDLCFELTRYGNLIANIIRKELDPSYRFDEGALLIRYGIDILWRDSTYRPEFTAQEIENRRQPYTSISNFLKDRPTRELSEAIVGSPRTIVGHQDPTRPPSAELGGSN